MSIMYTFKHDRQKSSSEIQGAEWAKKSVCAGYTVSSRSNHNNIIVLFNDTQINDIEQVCPQQGRTS